MPEFVFIADKISLVSLRDYIFIKKINKGDSIVLNPIDYEAIITDIKNSEEGLDIPINVLGILIIKDAAGDVPLGKAQIIKNEKH